jgi:uncharacterized protein with HEPN domain
MMVALDQILDFTKDKSFEEFRSSPITINAVLYSFAVLGEAANHVSREAAADHPEIEWLAIRGMRNTIVHEYTGVRLETVWETIRRDLPELRRKLAEILRDAP